MSHQSMTFRQDENGEWTVPAGLVTCYAAGEQGPEMIDVTTLSDTERKFIPRFPVKVCPNCGTSTHHKGFREWEECDGCAAEWSGV
jgi:hypothetical protein